MYVNFQKKKNLTKQSDLRKSAPPLPLNFNLNNEISDYMLFHMKIKKKARFYSKLVKFSVTSHPVYYNQNSFHNNVSTMVLLCLFWWIAILTIKLWWKKHGFQ